MATIKTTVLAWIGSVILVGTVAFHLTGLPMMATAAETPGLSGFVASALRPLWLFPAVHWLLIAALAPCAAMIGGRLAPVVLGASAVVLVIDAVLMFANIGPFLAEALLVATAVCYAVQAVRKPPAPT